MVESSTPLSLIFGLVGGGPNNHHSRVAESIVHAFSKARKSSKSGRMLLVLEDVQAIDGESLMVLKVSGEKKNLNA